MKKFYFIIVFFIFSSEISFAFECKDINYYTDYTYYNCLSAKLNCLTGDETYNYSCDNFTKDESYEAGFKLANIASIETISKISIWSSSKGISKEEYPYIKKWIITVFYKNPYDTMIVLRRHLYKYKLYTHDKNVERYLKRLYWLNP